MAQKNFDWDDRFAKYFTEYCADKGIVEKNLAGAGVLLMMTMDAANRDEHMSNYSKWLSSNLSLAADKAVKTKKNRGR